MKRFIVFKLLQFFLVGMVTFLLDGVTSTFADLIVKEPLKQYRFAIENKAISESSGLACSTRDTHLLWTHNDSGHMPIIYAMSHKGKDLATFHLDEIEAKDWEDMDAFFYRGKHYLLIADTGDNYRMMMGHRISIIREPIIRSEKRSAISPEWSFYFQFEDGQSYDIESVAVDVHREKIILLSKRNKPTLMFELPLKPDNEETIQLAVKTGELPEIKKPSALDISADGRWMSVNTYRRIHRFYRKQPDAHWQYHHSLKYKKLFQPEAMCLDFNSQFYYVSSEKKPYLLKIDAQSLKEK